MTTPSHEAIMEVVDAVEACLCDAETLEMLFKPDADGWVRAEQKEEIRAEVLKSRISGLKLALSLASALLSGGLVEKPATIRIDGKTPDEMIAECEAMIGKKSKQFTTATESELKSFRLCFATHQRSQDGQYD